MAAAFIYMTSLEGRFLNENATFLLENHEKVGWKVG